MAFVSCDLPASELRDLFALLDKNEREQAWSLRNETRRVNFIIGHGWRRKLLSALNPAIPPEAWMFETGLYGRPAVVQGGCDVSLSYSGGVAALAVTRGCRVGIDIERAGRSAAEASEGWGACPRGGRFESPDFLDRWTATEALAKCIGTGLGAEASDLKRLGAFGRPDAMPSPPALLHQGRVAFGAARLHLALAAMSMGGEDGAHIPASGPRRPDMVSVPHPAAHPGFEPGRGDPLASRR